MTEQVKGLAADPSDLSLSLRIHMREREPAPASCPPTTTYTWWHEYTNHMGAWRMHSWMLGWVDVLTIKKTLSLFLSNKVEQRLQHPQQLETEWWPERVLNPHYFSGEKAVCKHSRMYIWFGNTIMLKKYLWNNKC